MGTTTRQSWISIADKTGFLLSPISTLVSGGSNS
jgi:hypothetical protein